jgi:ketosteroid isomerase-like protein
VSSSSLALVEGLFAALQSGDLSLIRPGLAPDVTGVLPYAPNGEPEPFRVFPGKHAVMGYLASVVAAFSQRRLSGLTCYATGDGSTVFAEARGDFIQAGTGAPYCNVYVFKFTIRDGLITHIAEYANPVPVAKVMRLPLG